MSIGMKAIGTLIGIKPYHPNLLTKTYPATVYAIGAAKAENIKYILFYTTTKSEDTRLISFPRFADLIEY